MTKNIFDQILQKSKNSDDIFLVDRKKTYKDFYKKTKIFQQFIKKKVKKKSVICVCMNYSLSFVLDPV